MNPDSKLPPIFQLMQAEQKKKEARNRKLKTVLAIFFVLAGLAEFLESYLVGILLLMTGISLFPQFVKGIEVITKKTASTLLAYSIPCCLFLLSVVVSIATEREIPASSIKTHVSKSNRSPIETVSPALIKEYEKSQLAKKEQERKDRIEQIFSKWDGSVPSLVKYIKENMNDPDSFEHISTNYWENEDYILVAMKFRGKNAFGGKIINSITAKVDLDGNIIEVLNQ